MYEIPESSLALTVSLLIKDMTLDQLLGCSELEKEKLINSTYTGISKEEARTMVMDKVKETMSKEIASYIKDRENEAKMECDKKAREIIRDRIKPDINMLKQLKVEADTTDAELNKKLATEENNYNRLKVLLIGRS